MRALGVAASCAALALVAQPARAQQAPPPPYGWARPYGASPPAPRLSLVPVTLWSDTPGARFAVQFEDSHRAITRCRTACWVYLVDGTYRVEVTESDGVVGGSRTFDVNGATRVTLHPRSATAQWIGLAMGVAGPLVSAAGIVWAQTNANSDRNWGPGLGLAFAGLAVTAVGWVFFGRSQRPGVRVTHVSAWAGGHPVTSAR